MREILSHKLWIGNAADVRDVEQIMDSGILAIIDLAMEQAISSLPRTLVYCRFPITDGQQDSQSILRTAIETLVSFVQKGIPTLICCNAGMSRSPAVVAGAMAVLKGGYADEWLKKIVMGYPHDISPQLWQTVRRVCTEMQRRLSP